MADHRGQPDRRHLLAGAFGLLAAACTRSEPEPEAGASGPARGALEWAVAGDWRSAADRARDAWRKPAETLRFFGLRGGSVVVDLWPGAGWWTDILAPWLAANDGVYWAALFPPETAGDPAAAELVRRYRARYADQRTFGEIEYSAFGATTGALAPAGTADAVLMMTRLHDLMAAGLAEKAFADAFAALKPGGVLGVVQHRAAAGGVQDAAAADGYVQEPYVKQLAAEAGFAFVAASELNANPADTKDHPFGVWTLPPDRLTAPPGRPADPAFDRARYDRIGESDRMTLKFRKP